MKILHVSNSTYGEISHYGARSRYIIENSDSSNQYWVCARDIAGDISAGAAEAVLKKIPVHPVQQLNRAVAKFSGNRSGVLKAIGTGFDMSLLSYLKHSGPDHLDILHTWESVPRTINYLKKRYPGIVVLRDIVIAREFDYFNGTPVAQEEGITDFFLSPSEYTSECLIKWGISESKIFKVPFGVDTELFHPLTDKKNRKVRFAFSGGISFRKGSDTLLKAWNSLKLPDAELHLYGTLKKEMKQAVENAENVICYGHIRLDRELPQNDVFVFPSTLEGSAKSIYEALACGLPVISTREAGPVYQDSSEGFIINAGDAEDLADKIKKLYEDEVLRRSMSEKARILSEKYTWKAYTERILNTYNAITH